MSMSEMTVKQRVTNLEDLMAQLSRSTDQAQRSVTQLSQDMRASRERSEAEMREFREDMRASRERSEAEMREFSEEMRVWRERSEAGILEMRKKWGELSNKMGTMAEDLVAPSIPRILRETTKCPDGRVESMAVRVERLHPADRGRSQEFDVVAVCGEYVLINETKSRLDPQAVLDFAQRMLEARDFFPEYADKKFIGAIASLYVDESIVRYGEKQGLIVLGFGRDVMEVLNSPGFVPRKF